MKGQNLVKNCMDCERQGFMCEEDCPYELKEDSYKKPSLLAKRKAMKAEKSNAVAKATILCRSAKKNKGQKNLHECPKLSYVAADKNLQKQEERRERRKTKNVSK